MKTNLICITLIALFSSACFGAETVSSEKLLNAQIRMLNSKVKILNSKIQKQAAWIIVLEKKLKNSVPKTVVKTVAKRPVTKVTVEYDKQAAEIKVLKLAKNIKTVTVKPPIVKPTESHVRGMLTYAYARAKIAGKEETTVRATKTVNDARIKIQSMLDKGPITLTYQILDVGSTNDGDTRLTVGYPKETLATSGQKNTALTTKYRTFLVTMSSEQALGVSKGNTLVIKGKATLCDNICLYGYGNTCLLRSDDRSNYMRDRLIVLYHKAYKRQHNYAAIIPALFMRTFTFTLNDKEIKSAEFIEDPIKQSKPKQKPTTRPITKITVRYDKFKDSSIAQTKTVSMGLHKMQLILNFKGTQKPKQVKEVKLYIWRFGSSWAYLNYQPEKIIIIADGNKFTMDCSYSYSMSGNNTFESMFFSIPKAQLILLSKAKKIEAQLSSNEFDFSSVGIFSDMVRYLGDKQTVETSSKKSFKGNAYTAFFNHTASFSKAVAICKKMGGHLVYIETDEEMNFISKTFGDLRMWVGATDDLKEGDWRWLNGEKVSNKFWNTNEGNMGRTENKMFHYKGKFYDVAEPWANSRGFICEWELTNVK